MGSTRSWSSCEKGSFCWYAGRLYRATSVSILVGGRNKSRSYVKSGREEGKERKMSAKTLELIQWVKSKLEMTSRE